MCSQSIALLWSSQHRHLPCFEGRHQLPHVDMRCFLAYRVCFAAKLWRAVTSESESPRSWESTSVAAQVASISSLEHPSGVSP